MTPCPALAWVFAFHVTPCPALAWVPVTPHPSYLTHETSSTSRSTPSFPTDAHNAMV
jgi:hypothetical protein